MEAGFLFLNDNQKNILYRVESDDGNFEKRLEEDCTGVHGCLHYSVKPEKSLTLLEKM